MEKPRVIMCKGLPASGKSTWSREFVAKNPNFIRLNKDDFRAMIGGYSNIKERIVIHMRNEAISKAIHEMMGVIVDDTNFATEHERDVKEIAVNGGYEFETKFFDVPLAECLERNAKRENPVPEKVIRQMAAKYNVGLPKEVPNPCDTTKPRAFIFDIDGTLAKMNGRSPYDYTKVLTDLPQDDVIAMANMLITGGNKIIIVSGREGTMQCADDTKNWLAQYTYYDELYMRPEGDKRPDTEIKEEIFSKFILPKYNVVGVFDDRNRVVNRWRELGLRCYQVAEGNF